MSTVISHRPSLQVDGDLVLADSHSPFVPSSSARDVHHESEGSPHDDKESPFNPDGQSQHDAGEEARRLASTTPL